MPLAKLIDLALGLPRPIQQLKEDQFSTEPKPLRETHKRDIPLAVICLAFTVFTVTIWKMEWESIIAMEKSITAFSSETIQTISEFGGIESIDFIITFVKITALATSCMLMASPLILTVGLLTRTLLETFPNRKQNLVQKRDASNSHVRLT